MPVWPWSEEETKLKATKKTCINKPKDTISLKIWKINKAEVGRFVRHLVWKQMRPILTAWICRSQWKLAATLWWFTAAPKPLKIQVFWGSPSPQGSYSPYILGDTTRPRHITCVLVWSKSDRRRLRKTLHKQTDRQTDRQTDTTKIMVTWPWTN